MHVSMWSVTNDKRPLFKIEICIFPMFKKNAGSHLKASFLFPFAPRLPDSLVMYSMLYVVYSMLYVVYSMLYVVYSICYMLCILQYVYVICCVFCYMLCILCYVVYSMLYVICCVFYVMLCILCYMLCILFNNLHILKISPQLVLVKIFNYT